MPGGGEGGEHAGERAGGRTGGQPDPGGVVDRGGRRDRGEDAAKPVVDAAIDHEVGAVDGPLVDDGVGEIDVGVSAFAGRHNEARAVEDELYALAGDDGDVEADLAVLKVEGAVDVFGDV